MSCHLMVNPSGVQLDMLNSIAGGEDQSPDYVWESAGRVNESGDAVEIRLPLQPIRFRGGTNVRMGILFWRRVSRTRCIGLLAGAVARYMGVRSRELAHVRISAAVPVLCRLRLAHRAPRLR